jgi:cell division ATP-binding protein FtsE
VIDAVHVSKTYTRGVYALRDLSIRIDKGDFVFLTGPSGAGKSTLLRMLLRQEVPTDGELTVGGRNLATLTPRQVQAYRRSLGFVFQDFKLLQAKTVLENVSFVPRVLGMAAPQQQRRTFQVLKWVGLQHRMNASPEELSGGEQQRVAIARAVANAPLLLLADEPTGNLDPVTASYVFDALGALVKQSGLAALIATHNHELASRMDRRVTLADGKVVPL